MHFCIELFCERSSIDQCACQRCRRVLSNALLLDHSVVKGPEATIDRARSVLSNAVVSLLLDHSVVKGPEAVTAPLGSNASFTCVVENADLRWVINTNITLSLTAEDLWKKAANPINGFQPS